MCWSPPNCEMLRALRSSETLVIGQHLTDRSGEFVHARRRHDDRVATTMRFFGDAQKLAAIVLAQFHVKVFAFDLHFAGFDNAIHWNRAAILAAGLTKGKLIFVFPRFGTHEFAPKLRINSAPSSDGLLLFVPRDREIDLAFKGIDARDEYTQLVADRKAAPRLASEQSALRRLKCIKIIR